MSAGVGDAHVSLHFARPTYDTASLFQDLPPYFPTPTFPPKQAGLSQYRNIILQAAPSFCLKDWKTGTGRQPTETEALDS